MRTSVKYLLIPLLALLSCSGPELDPGPKSDAEGPVKVGFYAGQGADTRASAGVDGLSTEWQPGDGLSLWAFDADGNAVLDNMLFRAYGTDAARAFFSATLPEAMPEGTYTYRALYPVPSSISGGAARYTIPATQDGLCGGGAEIMMSDLAEAGALAPLEWGSISHDELHLNMRHLLHRLRFYIIDNGNYGNYIRKAVVSFPRAVAGAASVSLDGANALSLGEGGESTLTIEPRGSVAFSQDGSRNYLCAGIAPTAFADGEKMSVRVYTDSKVLLADIPLNSRTFAAGHSTPVNIIPTRVFDYCRLTLNFDSNNLGEDIQTITLSVPDGCSLTDSGERTLTLTVGRDIGFGGSLDIIFENEAAFRSLSGSRLTVTYDSEHIRIPETIAVGDLSGKNAVELSLNVPWLLNEDFSGVQSFSSNDGYKTSSAGSKDAYGPFLGGWTGGRIGAEAGKCIRIACRRETSVDYDARVDSAPLRGTVKSAVTLDVDFDYGADNEFSFALLTDPDVGQDCYVGYTTSNSAYESGSTSGTFDRSNNTFYVKEYSGNWDSTPDHFGCKLSVTPGSSGLVRISLRTEIEHRAGATNTTAWLYVDNIKVKVSNK